MKLLALAAALLTTVSSLTAAASATLAESCRAGDGPQGVVHSRLLAPAKLSVVSRSGYSWDKLDTVSVSGHLDLVTCRGNELYHVRYQEFVSKGAVSGAKKHELRDITASFGPSSKVAQADWFRVQLPKDLLDARLASDRGEFHIIVSFETSEYLSPQHNFDLPMAPLWGTNGSTHNPTANLTLYHAYLEGWWRDSLGKSGRAPIHTLLLNFQKVDGELVVSTLVLPVSGLTLRD